jgi:hypothetical protein
LSLEKRKDLIGKERMENGACKGWKNRFRRRWKIGLFVESF